MMRETTVDAVDTVQALPKTVCVVSMVRPWSCRLIDEAGTVVGNGGRWRSFSEQYAVES